MWWVDAAQLIETGGGARFPREHLDELIALVQGRESEGSALLRAELARRGLGADGPALALAALDARLFHAFATPWEILGLPPGSDGEVLRQRYRRLLRIFHPDRGLGDPAWCEERTNRILDAHRRIEAGQGNEPAELAPREPRPGAQPFSAGIREPGPLDRLREWLGAPEEFQVRFFAVLVGAIGVMLSVLFLAGTFEPPVPELVETGGVDAPTSGTGTAGERPSPMDSGAAPIDRAETPSAPGRGNGRGEDGALATARGSVDAPGPAPPGEETDPSERSIADAADRASAPPAGASDGRRARRREDGSVPAPAAGATTAPLASPAASPAASRGPRAAGDAVARAARSARPGAGKERAPAAPARNDASTASEAALGPAARDRSVALARVEVPSVPAAGSAPAPDQSPRAPAAAASRAAGEAVTSRGASSRSPGSRRSGAALDRSTAGASTSASAASRVEESGAQASRSPRRGDETPVASSPPDPVAGAPGAGEPGRVRGAPGGRPAPAVTASTRRVESERAPARPRVIDLCARADEVIDAFLDHYRRDRVDAMMALYDADAVENDARGLRDIRTLYETFFAITSDRDLAIDTRSRVLVGENLCLVQGNYSARFVDADGDRHATSGPISIYLMAQEDRSLRIARMQY